MEKWTEWYDATIPLVTDIKIIAVAMEVELSKRHGMQLESEPDQRGGDQKSERHGIKVSMTETLIPHAERIRRSKDRALGQYPAVVDEYIKTEAQPGLPTRR